MVGLAILKMKREKMRDLNKLIDDMKAVIPTTESRFLARLSKIQTNLGYTPPEMMAGRWHQVHAVLVEESPEENADPEFWGSKLRVLWSATE